MQVEKITGFVGAELSGVDLSSALPNDTAAALRTALAAHGVLVARGQHLDIAAQKRLTEIFGPLMKLPYIAPMPDEPQVIAVLKHACERNTGVFGGDWHADFSFLEKPPAGSVLTAQDLPPVGGDTLFACQRAAHDTLPPDLRRFLDGRKAVHLGAPYGQRHAPPEDGRAGSGIAITRGDPEADRERLHPAVLTDPVTGALSLFLNPIYTTRFEGMSPDESAPILTRLLNHATRPDISCRIRWGAGDVAIWDNRAVLHYATNDYEGHRRLMHRTTWAGDTPA